jgi:hypothetical protein
MSHPVGRRQMGNPSSSCSRPGAVRWPGAEAPGAARRQASRCLRVRAPARLSCNDVRPTGGTSLRIRQAFLLRTEQHAATPTDVGSVVSSLILRSPRYNRRASRSSRPRCRSNCSLPIPSVSARPAPAVLALSSIFPGIRHARLTREIERSRMEPRCDRDNGRLVSRQRACR